MRSVMVVTVLPVLAHVSDSGQRGKDVAIEHFGAEGAVEALDVRVLGGFTRLVMQQFDAMALRPLFERRADELLAVVPSEA